MSTDLTDPELVRIASLDSWGDLQNEIFRLGQEVRALQSALAYAHADIDELRKRLQPS